MLNKSLFRIATNEAEVPGSRIDRSHQYIAKFEPHEQHAGTVAEWNVRKVTNCRPLQPGCDKNAAMHGLESNQEHRRYGVIATYSVIQ
jgi:hypothetical protein